MKKLKKETLEKRISQLIYNMEIYPENIMTYKGKTNEDLDNADRFILMVAVQEKEIQHFDIRELVAKWENDLQRMAQRLDEYKKQL